MKPYTLGAAPPGDALTDFGLSHADVDEMVAAYQRYLTLQPKAHDKRDIQEFLRWVGTNRPPESVKKWLIGPSETTQH
jgi:hypothetical protein